MAGYGYYQWSKGGDEGTEKPVRSWPLWIHLTIVPVLLCCAWGLSKLVTAQFNSDHLLLDASIQLLSIVTTFMVAHKVLQNWIYWFLLIWPPPFYIFKWGWHYQHACSLDT